MLRNKLRLPLFLLDHHRWYLWYVVVFLFLMCTSLEAQELPFKVPPSSDIKKLKTLVIETAKGNLTFELFPQDAPMHVANLKYLADKEYYKNTSFHFYFRDYILQAGRSRSGSWGPKYTIRPEFGSRKHRRGTLGMARTSDAVNLERRSSSSQFHILLANSPHMDGKYTIVGQLVRGWETLDKLREGDLIFNFTVFVRPSP